MVEKLKGRENYANWKFAVQAWLQLDDLWEVVTGESKNEAKDRKALAKIVLSLESINFCHVQSAKSAKEAWLALQNAFEDSGLTRRVGLLRKLITTRLENCKSIEEYVDQITSTAHKLNGIGFSVSEEWVGSLLLAGLPDHYKPMIMGLESSGTKLTGDAIKVKLLQDVQVSEDVKNSESETAMYARNTRKKGPPKCYTCNKIGHFASQCRTKKTFNNKKEEKVKGTSNRAFLASGTEENHSEWYVDSGASAHIVNDKKWITKSVQKSDATIIAANNTNFKAKLVGTAELKVTNGRNNSTVDVKETLYIPEATANLLSVSKIVEKGHSVYFDTDGGKIVDEDGEIIATATEVNGIYKLDQTSTEKVYFSKESEDGVLWHRRLGHLNRKGMRLLKKISTGIKDNLNMEEHCQECVKGKQAREPFNVSKRHATDKLELVHTDLCGPMEVESIGGGKYFLTFIDDYSRYLHVYILTSKDQVADTFIDFKNYIEKQTGKKIKKIRSDNGKEYLNEKIKSFLRSEGIVHQLTVRYTPQQNGVAERMNRSIVEKARTLLIDAGLGKEYWAEAVATAAYLLNRSPTRRLWNMTPYEAFKGEKPDLSHLRMFGCEAMAQIPKELRKKWDPKSQKLLMMGYSETKKAYRLINPENKNIVFSRDVKFFERKMSDSMIEMVTKPTEKKDEKILVQLEDNTNSDSSDTYTESENYKDVEISEEQDTFLEEENVENRESENEQGKEVTEENFENDTDEEEVRTTRSGRKINKPVKYNDYVTYLVKNGDYYDNEPNSIEEALSGSNSENWKEAMGKEMEALKKNNVYELTNLPAGKKPLKTKWVFKEKIEKEGVKKYKARLVIKGCSQKQGIDYQETFSPVVKYASLRYLFSIAAAKNLRIDHMDVTTAYLNGPIDEEIYVTPPPDFEGKTEEGKVWKLKKAVYGLKQSGRCWNIKLNEVITSLGLIQCKSDPCIYTLKSKPGQILIVAIYVDDLLVFSNNKKLRENLKKNLMSNFDMKDLGVAKQCLGMNITKEKGKIFIDQKDYTEKILQKFNMYDCKAVDTPLEKGLDFEMCGNEKSPDVPYQEAVGSLLYLSQISRPDIAFATSLLSRFNNNFKTAHWNAIKRVFRYLKGTLDYKLCFDNNCDPISFFDAYCDADWGNKLNNRYSVTGACVKVNGGLISWHSKRQKTVALSTVEAEYMAMSFTIQESLWVKQLIWEIGIDNYQTVTVHCDNKGAIDLATNNITSQRSKHIDIRHHFVRDHVNNKNVKVLYMSSDEMPSDVLTKPLSKEQHKKCINFLGLKC